jgi:hypothetical protein
MANQLNDQERADLEYMPKLEYYEYEVDCTGYPSSSRPRTYETSRSTQPTAPAVEAYDHVAQSWYNPEVYKCVCYDDGPGQYFDGQPGLGLDSRFTIDLEGGTMDRYDFNHLLCTDADDQVERCPTVSILRRMVDCGRDLGP